MIIIEYCVGTKLVLLSTNLLPTNDSNNYWIGKRQELVTCCSNIDRCSSSVKICRVNGAVWNRRIDLIATKASCMLFQQAAIARWIISSLTVSHREGRYSQKILSFLLIVLTLIRICRNYCCSSCYYWNCWPDCIQWLLLHIRITNNYYCY